MVSSLPPELPAWTPVVTKLPLDSLQLWDGTELERSTELDAAAVKPLLRYGVDVVLVVASVSKPLRRLSGDEMRAFWRDDAAVRIAPRDRPAYLTDFLGDRL